ncbi:MAG: ABC transporter ATP-binding protein [Myxococcales bacterium]|nr:ABC transporter ATP-binding protein [Myxococcales bacterium]
MSSAATLEPETSQSRLGRLAGYLRENWIGFAVGSLFVLVTQYLAFAIPKQLGAAVQLLKNADDGRIELAVARDSVIEHALIIICLAVGAAITRICSRILIFNAARQTEYQLRNQLFARLSILSPRYYASIPTGDLTSRVINDTNYVRLLFGIGILHITNTSFVYLMAMANMIDLDPSLAVLCLVPYPLFLFIVQMLARKIHTYTTAMQEKLADLSAECQEHLSGIAVVKAYAVEPQREARFWRKSEEYVEAGLDQTKVRTFLMPVMQSMGSVGALLVLYFGARAVIVDGSLDTGQFIEFSGYVALLSWPTIAMGWVISVWQRGTAAFDRITEVIDSQPDIAAPEPGEQNPIQEGKIHFEHVTFTYPGEEKPALDDVTFDISAGAKVGIVGRSGSGKTTLVNLIPRLFDVDSGTIAIDGTPVQDIPLVHLREAIGYAPQEPFLFSTTLEKNIRLGYDARAALSGRAPDESEATAAVDQAMDSSQFSQDMDALPNGLETMVGERGITLSGGQKQRVALARALMTRPTILILDDSLSSVDVETEKEILERLDREMAGRTTLVVSHRFSVLELLDEVLVLDSGQLVERGSHRELMELGGVYSRMVEQQRLTEEVESLE